MLVVRVQERILAALLPNQADMRVSATGRLVGEWLGHEGGMIAELAGNELNTILEGKAEVTRSQCPVRPVVDLELSGAILAVGGDDIDADLRHQFDDAFRDG